MSSMQHHYHHRVRLSIIVEGNELNGDDDVSDESMPNSPAVGSDEHNKMDDEHKTVRAWKVKRDSLTRRKS